PVLVTAIGSILWTISVRNLFTTPSSTALTLYGLLLAGGALLIMGGHIFNLLVMGGATRNLVTHLLWNEPVSARATYSAVRSRFWALLLATLIVSFWVAMSLSIGLFGWYIVVTVVTLGAVLLAQVLPVWCPAVVGIAGFVAGS